MAVETGVLGGDRRLHEVQGQLFVTDESSVLDMVGGQDLAFFRDDLRGQLAVRVLQFLVGRNLGERPDDSQEEDYQGDRSEKEDPEPADDLLFGILCHLKKL